MFNRIPPVGNPISWQHPAPPPTLVTHQEQCLFFQSGTAALAQALIIAKSAFKTDTPEVIVPAYTCPDIISAAVYAGVTPVLVDLEADRPYMSLPAIENAITNNTIAIIAINFLGIPERIAAIRTSLGNSGVIVIEDSAQWFPDTSPAAPDSAQAISNQYQGDMVVLSFGKGKPVSLMGGGALLIKQPKRASLAEQINTVEKTPSQEQSDKPTNTLTTSLLYMAYNMAISRYGYWLLELLPGLKLGETHYTPLNTIDPMDNNRLLLLASNRQRYQQRPLTAQQAIHQMLANNSPQQVTDLPEQCQTYQQQRLLRYPILMPSASAKNHALKALEQAGCGASPLYPTILPNIAGVSEHLNTTPSLSSSTKSASSTRSLSTNASSIGSLEFKNATSFASRLITLPTHGAVTNHQLAIIEQVLQRNE